MLSTKRTVRLGVRRYWRPAAGSPSPPSEVDFLLSLAVKVIILGRFLGSVKAYELRAYELRESRRRSNLALDTKRAGQEVS